MTDGVVIVGGGGMAREALAWCLDVDMDVVGFAVDETTGRVCGLPIVGDIASVLTGDHPNSFLIAIGDPVVRARLHTEFTARSLALQTVVHPTAYVGPGVFLGNGTIVAPNVTLTRDIKIGVCAIVNYGAQIGHDGEIGPYAFVGPGSSLAGNVVVETRAWIGIGASVREGVRIGADAIVGAGAVVIRDVPSGTTVVGNPARPRHQETP